MCMIAASISGRKLTKREFKDAWRTNADGFGYAYAKGGKTHFRKGYLKLKSAWKAYHDIPDGLPHVCHFRLGTHGSRCEELTHPFVCEWSDDLPLIGETDKPVIFHNGVYSDWKDTLISLSIKHGHIPEGEMSDTRVIAFLVGEVGIRALDYLSGKFAIFTNSKLLIDGDWAKEEDGVKFSSTSYSYSTTSFLHGDEGEYYNTFGIPARYSEEELEDLAYLVDDSKGTKPLDIYRTWDDRAKDIRSKWGGKELSWNK